jgi:crossover junction endodeoxyribonuclease RuvC
MLDGDEHRVKMVTFPKIKGFQRVMSIESEAERTLDLWQPDHAVIEAYNLRNKFSLVDLVEIGTIFRRALYRRGIIWYEVPPTTLKKWVTGSGKAEKSDMLASATSKWGFHSPDDNIVDAYCLSRLGSLPIEELLAIKGVSRVA